MKNLKEVDEKTMKDVYANIVKAILVIFYFLIVNLAYENVNIETLNRGIQLFTMIFLFITIFIFEISYKKDDTKLAIEGIELLVLSFITLTIDHVITKYHFELKPYALVISYVYAIYFILKGIVIYTKGRKQYADSLSDIREIVKKEEPAKKESKRDSTEIDNKENENKIEEKQIENKKEKTNQKEKSKTKNSKDENINKPKKTTTKATTKTTSKTTTKRTTKKKVSNSKESIKNDIKEGK